MKCSKCGSETTSESKFCLSCGEPMMAQRSEAVSPAAPKKPLGLWAAFAGLCVLAAIAIILALRLYGPKVTEATPVSNPQQTPVVSPSPIPDAPQPGILDTGVEKAPIGLNPPEKPEPPADVVAYLEHLKRVEKARQEISARELNDLVARAPEIIMKAYGMDGDLDGKQGAKDLSGQAAKYSREWQQLARYFLMMPPPPPCAVLAQKYYDSLRIFVMFMASFQNAVGKSDLAGVKQIQREQIRVDQKLIEADQELARVCDEHGIQKSFSIQADTGKTPILGL